MDGPKAGVAIMGRRGCATPVIRRQWRRPAPVAWGSGPYIVLENADADRPRPDTVTALQVLELVIFAALAAVVLFQLYAVLGRRVGRQPEDAAEAEGPRAPAEADLRRPGEPVEAHALSGVAAIQARDPSFDPSQFLAGARQAYEMVVLAFAAGDRDTLRNLTSPSVYQTFDKAISARDAEGRTEKVEFLHPPRADLESADMIGNLAQARVRFLAEFRTRSTGPEGEAVDDRRTAEVWTFERPVDSRDPNWALARVDAAES